MTRETPSPNAPSFDEVCRLLHAGHGKGSAAPEDTLNRLFRKHLAVHQKDIADNPPRLSSSNVEATTEMWPTAALRQLASRNQSRPPRFEDFPVVIVRYRGRDCLIDGGSRIHAWSEAGDAVDHRAYVLAVNDTLA